VCGGRDGCNDVGGLSVRGRVGKGMGPFAWRIIYGCHFLLRGERSL
jgi:hypothetical protein